MCQPQCRAPWRQTEKLSSVESPAHPYAAGAGAVLRRAQPEAACRRSRRCKLHEGDDALDAAGLIEAARDVEIIVADRLTAGPGEIFPQLPKLRAFVRCAVDIRNIDVDAASAAGVLVTQAGPGFVQSVAELAVGFMVDLSRGVSRATRGLPCRTKA